MSKIERVRKVCKWLIYNDYAQNDKELADKLGYTKSSFSQILNEKVPLSEKFIENLCNADENINKVWILTGKGNMILSDDPQADQILNDIERIPEGFNRSGKGLPLIPLDAMAGYGVGSIQIKEGDIAEYYEVPLFQSRGAKYLIPVAGNSMYPKYNSGDLLACKPLSDLSFVQWGKPYVLDTEQGVIVKRLFENTEDKNLLICKSDNIEFFPPFNIPLTAIYGVAIVVGLIRVE